MAAVRIDIGVEKKGVSRDIKEIEKQIKSTQKEIEKLNAPKKSEAMKSLERSLDTIQKKAERLQKELDRARSKEKEIDRNIDNGVYTSDSSTRRALGNRQAAVEKQDEIRPKIIELLKEEASIMDAIDSLQERENEESDEAVRKLEEKLGLLEEEKAKTLSIASIIKGAVSTVGKLTGLGVFKKITESAAHLFKSDKSVDGMSKGMKNVASSATRMLGALVGARSLYALLSKAINQIKEQNKELADTINSLWNGLIELISPTINMIVNALATALNYVIKMVSLISGLNILGAIKKGNKKAAKGGSGSGGQLASFDSSEVLNKSGGGADSTTEGYLKDIELNEELLKLIERLKSMWEKVLTIVNNLVAGIKKGLDYMNSGQRILKTLKTLFSAILDDIDHMLDATVDWSADLNFGYMFDSMASAFESLEPILEKVGDLLVWLYENCFLPLSKWIIEELVPAFNNNLVPIFDVINECLEILEPILAQLWEDTLKPMFDFIGDTVIGMLDDIGTWFEENSEWIKTPLSGSASCSAS